MQHSPQDSGPWVLNCISEISYTHILNARVANVKNQPQATYTMGMKSLLMLKPSHTETSSPVLLHANCTETALGSKFGRYHHDDVPVMHI